MAASHTTPRRPSARLALRLAGGALAALALAGAPACSLSSDLAIAGCQSSAECGAGRACVQGRCEVECRLDSDCTDGALCSFNRCIAPVSPRVDAEAPGDARVDASVADALPPDAAPVDAAPVDAAPADAMPVDAAPLD
ncbi:MAG: hypothetical protein R3F43_32715, partial [bacterium]